MSYPQLETDATATFASPDWANRGPTPLLPYSQLAGVLPATVRDAPPHGLEKGPGFSPGQAQPEEPARARSQGAANEIAPCCEAQLSANGRWRRLCGGGPQRGRNFPAACPPRALHEKLIGEDHELLDP